MKDPNVFLQQAGLKSLGFDPGPLDGDPGPKTAAAKSAWLASLNQPSALATRMVETALSQIGIHETSKNHGDGIAKFWTATDYPEGYANREPYCAAFLCWVIAQAVGKDSVPFPLPKTAEAFGYEKWGHDKKGVLVLSPSSPLLPGDILVFTFSHVGIVEKAVTESSIATIEANTDPMSTNSNEGGGVYRRRRARSLVRSAFRIL